MCASVELLNSRGLFLVPNLTMEVPVSHVTHVEVEGHYTSFMDAARNLESASADQRAKRVLRYAAVKTLRALLHTLIDELTLLSSPSAPRLLDFGLNMPAGNRIPDVPAELTVADGARGHLLAGWTRPARAQRFHVSEWW